MLTISQIFIIVFILIVLVSILCIFEWYRLGTLSSELSNIEREIELKSKEFDSIRKERTPESSSQGHTIFPNVPVSFETSHHIDSPNEIQIMKNVGGTFKETSQIAHESHRITTFAKSGKIVHHPQPEPVPASDYIQPLLSNEQGIQSESIPSQRKITLYLYSDISKDADFNGLWQNLKLYLSNEYPMEISIDFTGVQFLYNNELDYLETICMHIEKLNGILIFLQCDQEILSLMQSRPKLISKVKV